MITKKVSQEVNMLGSKPNNKQSGNDFTERGSGRWAGLAKTVLLEWCSVIETSRRTTVVFGYRGEIRQ